MRFKKATTNNKLILLDNCVFRSRFVTKANAYEEKRYNYIEVDCSLLSSETILIAKRNTLFSSPLRGFPALYALRFWSLLMSIGYELSREIRINHNLNMEGGLYDSEAYSRWGNLR